MLALLAWLVVGGIAGWLASRAVAGGGFGVLLLSRLIVASVSAAILLLLLRLLGVGRCATV